MLVHPYAILVGNELINHFVWLLVVQVFLMQESEDDDVVVGLAKTLEDLAVDLSISHFLET